MTLQQRAATPPNILQRFLPKPRVKGCDFNLVTLASWRGKLYHTKLKHKPIECAMRSESLTGSEIER